jgi:hypothetical protein
MTDPDYEALAEQAVKDHAEANERYSQAFRDSEYAAFQELVFTAAAAGVTVVNLEPSDQGEHMTITDYEGGDDDVEEMLDQAAMDLADNMSAHWTMLPGVTYEGSKRNSDNASIDIKVAAEALIAAITD